MTPQQPNSTYYQSNTNPIMLKTIERQNEYIHCLNSILTAYESVIYVSLHDFSFKIFTGTPEVKAYANKQSNILSVIKMFGEYQLKPEHRKTFYEFLDPLTLAERLNGQKYITMEYDTMNLGWVHARLIPTEYDVQGNILGAIFTTECIEAEHNEHEILRYASETDALTGLPNRSKGQKMAEELFNKNTPLVFVLFDCDRFKHINDTMSHLVGDKVLVAVADVLRNYLGDHCLFRLGGDEFVTVISGDIAQQIINEYNDITIYADASQCSFFKELQEKINSISIQELGEETLTLSGGAVIYKGEEVSFNDIYRKSDKALQISKSHRTGIVTIVNM